MENKGIYLYLLADTAQPAVQEFAQALKKLDYVVELLPSMEAAVNLVAHESSHLIICLSPNMEVNMFRTIAQRAMITGTHLYFIGVGETVFPNSGFFIDSIPGVHISSLPVDLEHLSEVIECNGRKKKRVLVVDDEPILLRSVKLWLGNDFEVSLVNSGETAIEFLNMNVADLVLLDYRMPGMTGPDVLKALRQNELTKRIPIIFLTGKNDRESIVQVMSLKPDGYILKSKPPEEIKAAVTDFFRSRIVHI